MDGEISQVQDALLYAHELRERHIVSTVYALPNKIRIDIHERFAKGESSRQIARAINTKYHEDIKGELLRPITHTAINNYRNHYWRKSPAYRSVLIRGDDSLVEEIESVRNDVNAYLELIALAKIQMVRVHQLVRLEGNLPVTMSSTRQEFELAIKLLSQMIKIELDLGIRAKDKVYLERQ